MRKSKLGIQTLCVAGKALSWVLDVKPRIFKLVIVSDQDFTDWPIPPEVFVVARYYGKGDWEIDRWEWTDANARSIARKMVEVAALHNGRIDAWEFINEPAPSSVASMKRLARYTRIWAEEMQKHGLKTIVGNFPVGNPEPELMPYFRPALAIANYFGYHGYGKPKAVGDEWTTFRYRKLLEAARIERPVILTECGVDCGGPYKGYRKYWSDDEYVAQLIELDRELQTDERVFGACVYCYGTLDSKWHSFDLTARAAMLLGDYIKKEGDLVEKPGLEEELRNWAWNHLPWGKIPYNPDAALAKTAIQERLGMPLTGEIRREVRIEDPATKKVHTRTVVFQVFTLGIVWCFEGAYDLVHVVR